MPHDAEDRHDEPRPVALDALRSELEPPAELEERVVRALRGQGLIGTTVPPTARRRTLRFAAVAASLLVALVLGFTGGRMAGGRDVPAVPDYILLVRPGPGETEAPNPEEELRRFREYASWYRDLASRGRVVGGEKLADDGFLLTGGARAVREPARSATVGGYFLIRAADDAEAERIASGCPHLKYGGVLEIRRIDRPEGES